MTVASGGGYPRGRWFVEFVSHKIVYVVVMTVLCGWVGLFLPSDWRHLILSIGDTLVVVLMLLMLLWHGRGLCIRCLRDAPTDGSVRAEKHRRWLRLWHQAQTYRLLIVWVVVVGFTYVPFVPRWVSDLPLDIEVIAYFSLMRFHDRLVVWCPWCGWGGGGEREAAPDPDPSQTKNPQPA